MNTTESRDSRVNAPSAGAGAGHVRTATASAHGDDARLVGGD